MIARLLFCLLLVIAPDLSADEVGILRQQVADLRTQLQQRGDLNSNWLLQQQVRELKSTVAQQEMRIRELEALVVAAGLRERAPRHPTGGPEGELAARLTELCKRTSWGEAVPAATCKQLGVDQAAPTRE